ncbi:MAG: radical SAM protein [Thermoflexales bacterium]
MPRRVLLINPRMASRNSLRLPLSLLALGAALEGRHDYQIIDGNVDDDAIGTALRALDEAPHAAVGLTVMPGPQVGPAIAISAAIRAAHPGVPIVWGGYFPTLYTSAAINAPYVDACARGPGEDTLLEFLKAGSAAGVPGLTWKNGNRIVHNPDRPLRGSDDYPPLPYDRLGDVGRYLRPSFLGARTAVHQAAVGCRYHCAFCGVVSMFNGQTRLSRPARIAEAMRTLRDRYGATAIQFYDHNFFDREESSAEIVEAMAGVALPWWCYARADALAGFSDRTWALIQASKLRMAYIGAEAASDSVLRSMKKGTTTEHTLEAARRCRAHGVIPEFSFVLGGPEDPEGEIETTLAFIRRLKAIHPECEVILYFYSPTPQRDPRSARGDGPRLPALETYGPGGPALPSTPEEWTEPRWIDYVCHRDAPWLNPRIRQHVRDFGRVLQCRFPTVQDVRTPAWGKAILRAAASWRYAQGRYDGPRELEWLRRMIPLREPERESL